MDNNKTGFTKSEKKNVPELCEKKANCCGCTACSVICPAHAIQMHTDEEGFLYPKIDTSKCIRCGACVKACVFKADQRQKGYLSDGGSVSERMPISEPVAFAVKHKDEEIRAASRSGGIFTALSDAVLSEQGIIYGCVMTDDFRAVHVRAEDAETRDRMRGSKYIQSELGDVFQQVKTDLQQGRKVLFSGTSCQIAGLRSYLTKPYENLLCIDIVCHGVPSPLVWQHYLDWQAELAQSPVKSVDFRNKKDYGWKAHIETITFENGKRLDSEVFKYLFSSTLVERPSCYKCPYKSFERSGDITLADYWGIDKAAPGFNDNKGVSLVLVNNEKGRERFESVKDMFDFRETRIEDSSQPALEAPFPPPENRDHFWKDFHNKDFGYIAKKYGTISFMSKLKKKIRRLLK